MDYSTFDLSSIARVIYKDWGAKVNYAAKPYLEAMATLTTIDDMYYADDGSSIVAYFLSNSSHWTGQIAREIKKELRCRL